MENPSKVTILQNRQYKIRVDIPDKITFLIARFLKKLEVRPRITSMLSAMVKPTSSTGKFLLKRTDPPISFSDNAYSATGFPIKNTSTFLWHSQHKPTKIPVSPSGLLPHNSAGLKEMPSPSQAVPACKGAEGGCMSYPSYPLFWQIFGEKQQIWLPTLIRCRSNIYSSIRFYQINIPRV